jgi:hypothetical protein
MSRKDQRPVPPSPHDALFKAAFGQSDLARSELRRPDDSPPKLAFPGWAEAWDEDRGRMGLLCARCLKCKDRGGGG